MILTLDCDVLLLDCDCICIAVLLIAAELVKKTVNIRLIWQAKDKEVRLCIPLWGRTNYCRFGLRSNADPQKNPKLCIIFAKELIKCPSFELDCYSCLLLCIGVFFPIFFNFLLQIDKIVDFIVQKFLAQLVLHFLTQNLFSKWYIVCWILALLKYIWWAGNRLLLLLL